MQWIADNLFVGQQAVHRANSQSATASASIYATSSSRSSCSARGVTTSPRHIRRWAGSWTCTAMRGKSSTNGQTIVYTMHQTSAISAFSYQGRWQRRNMVSSCRHGPDRCLPPGLYEAVITEVDETTANPDLVQGRYLFRLEARTLDHIRALGGNDAEDDRRFAPQPASRRSISACIARWLRPRAAR